MVGVKIYILCAAIQAIDGVASLQIAANQQRVMTAHGKQVTLSCKTEDRAPLRYCQFQPPDGKPFSIDSDVTPEKAIQERFYFPPNKSLSRGDCAVFIHKVKLQDVGRWTCCVELDDGNKYQGTIILQFKGDNTVVAVIALLAAIDCFCFLAYIVAFIIKQKDGYDGQTKQTPMRIPKIPIQLSTLTTPINVPIINIQPPTPRSPTASP